MNGRADCIGLVWPRALIAGAAVAAAWVLYPGSGPSRPPLGLPATAVAKPDAAAAELGRRLFSDVRLSVNGKMSCATCHKPEQGFTDNGRATPHGRNGRPLRRNASTLLNVGMATPLMHDGAAPSLESQVLTPLLDSNEMANGTFEELERRLASVPEYNRAFRSVFGGAPSMARIGSALAAYQRTLASANSPFDRWRFGGESDALGEEAKRGFVLFSGKAGCTGCHLIGETSALFTDNAMHNTGVAAGVTAGGDVRVASRSGSSTIDFAAAGDRGRHEITQNPADLYRYRTPTLRNVALTAPYMHNGVMASLSDVVRFYNAGGGANGNLDPAIKPLGLQDREIDDLVAFLNSLTGDNVQQLAADAKVAAPRISP